LMAGAPSWEFAFHGALFFAFFVGGCFMLVKRHYDLRDGVLAADRAVDGIAYNDGPIRLAVVASVVWGLAGFLVGVVIAFQLAFPALNLDLPWSNFGRLRPLH